MSYGPSPAPMTVISGVKEDRSARMIQRVGLWSSIITLVLLIATLIFTYGFASSFAPDSVTIIVRASAIVIQVLGVVGLAATLLGWWRIIRNWRAFKLKDFVRDQAVDQTLNQAQNIVANPFIFANIGRAFATVVFGLATIFDLSSAQMSQPPPLTVQPASYFLQCQFDAFGNYFDPPPANLITLDNRRNSVSLDWSAVITDNDPAGKTWASTSPASGTIPAGQTMSVTIIPNSNFCHDLQTIRLGTYHVKFGYHITGQSIPAAISVQILAS